MRPIVPFAAAAILFSAPAHATTCSPRFVDASKTVTIAGITVGSGSIATSGFQIRVRNTGDGACSATLRIARLSTTLPGNRLPLTLSSGGSSLQILANDRVSGTAGSDLTVPGIPSGSGGRAVPFVAGISTDWGIASGYYSEEFQLSLIDATGATTDTSLLTIQFNVPPSVALRIVGVTGTNEVAEINLGTLDPSARNRSDPFGLRIWSTSPYSVSFLSANAGNLEQVDGKDRIPYNLMMGGRPMDVVGSSPVTFGRHTPALGDLHRLAVTVAPFNALAGNYSDRVTVTVQAF